MNFEEICRLKEIKTKEIENMDFFIKPSQEGGPIIYGVSKSLHAHCSVRLSDKLLKQDGLDYLVWLCNSIGRNIYHQFKNRILSPVDGDDLEAVEKHREKLNQASNCILKVIK